MTAADPLVVSTRADLLALPQRLSLRQPPQRLSLDLPGLQEPDRSLIEARLATHLSACGCNEGAIALVLALVPAGLGAVALPNGLAPWACWAVFFAVLVAASVSGKLYGLHRARRRLHSEVGHILATVA